MDVFAGNNPDLINNTLINDIEAGLSNNNERHKLVEALRNFYENFVQCNMFPIIVVSFLCFYLFIKYLLKNKSPKIKKQRRLSSTQEVKQRGDNIVNVAHDNNDIASYIPNDYLLTDTSENKEQIIPYQTNIVRNDPRFTFDNIELFNSS